MRVPEVADPDFVAEVAFAPGGPAGEVALVLTGSADHSCKLPLRGLLDQLHAELSAHGHARVVVDMRALDAMAAPCVTELLAWLYRVQDLETHARYRIAFHINRSIAWQAGAVKALACFDTSLVTVA